MDAIQDFEDFLDLLDPEPANLRRANEAIAEFGSPHLLDLSRGDEILQLGVAPNRIDLLREAAPLAFADAWERRVEGTYGRARACWIGLEDLLAVKERIDHPRHREDARVLRKVLERERGRE